MKKRISVLGLVVLMSLSFSTLSFAGEWKNDTTGWWYVNDNSYPVNEWAWIDGNNDGVAECYHFDDSGYMVANTTVDNYTVNENGAWVLNGVVQTKQVCIEENADEVYRSAPDKRNEESVANSFNRGVLDLSDIPVRGGGSGSGNWN